MAEFFFLGKGRAARRGGLNSADSRVGVIFWFAGLKGLCGFLFSIFCVFFVCFSFFCGVWGVIDRRDDFCNDFFLFSFFFRVWNWCVLLFLFYVFVRFLFPPSGGCCNGS